MIWLRIFLRLLRLLDRQSPPLPRPRTFRTLRNGTIISTAWLLAVAIANAAPTEIAGPSNTVDFSSPYAGMTDVPAGSYKIFVRYHPTTVATSGPDPLSVNINFAGAIAVQPSATTWTQDAALAGHKLLLVTTIEHPGGSMVMEASSTGSAAFSGWAYELDGGPGGGAPDPPTTSIPYAAGIEVGMGTQLALIAGSGGDQVWYTLDGDDPITDGSPIEGVLVLNASVTLKMATKNSTSGAFSSVVTQMWGVIANPPAPSVLPAASAVEFPYYIEIPGSLVATHYYRLDGNNPGPADVLNRPDVFGAGAGTSVGSSGAMLGPFSSPQTIKVISKSNDGFAWSSITTRSFTEYVPPEQCLAPNTPTCFVPGGTYTNYPLGINVSVPGGAQGIVYTTDGSTPSVSPGNGTFAEYAAPGVIVNVAEPSTLKVLAFRTSNGGMTYCASGVRTELYARETETVATPVWVPTSRGFEDELTVNVTCATPGAVIRYSVGDISSPPVTEDSPIWAGPITITSTKYFRARAFKEGMDPSQQASADYIHAPPFGDDDLPALITVEPIGSPGPNGCYQLPVSFRVVLVRPRMAANHNGSGELVGYTAQATTVGTGTSPVIAATTQEGAEGVYTATSAPGCGSGAQTARVTASFTPTIDVGFVQAAGPAAWTEVTVCCPPGGGDGGTGHCCNCCCSQCQAADRQQWEDDWGQVEDEEHEDYDDDGCPDYKDPAPDDAEIGCDHRPGIEESELRQMIPVSDLGVGTLPQTEFVFSLPFQIPGTGTMWYGISTKPALNTPLGQTLEAFRLLCRGLGTVAVWLFFAYRCIYVVRQY